MIEEKDKKLNAEKERLIELSKRSKNSLMIPPPEMMTVKQRWRYFGFVQDFFDYATEWKRKSESEIDDAKFRKKIQEKDEKDLEDVSTDTTAMHNDTLQLLKYYKLKEIPPHSEPVELPYLQNFEEVHLRPRIRTLLRHLHHPDDITDLHSVGVTQEFLDCVQSYWDYLDELELVIEVYDADHTNMRVGNAQREDMSVVFFIRVVAQEVVYFGEGPTIQEGRYLFVCEEVEPETYLFTFFAKYGPKSKWEEFDPNAYATEQRQEQERQEKQNKEQQESSGATTEQKNEGADTTEEKK